MEIVLLSPSFHLSDLGTAALHILRRLFFDLALGGLHLSGSWRSKIWTFTLVFDYARLAYVSIFDVVVVSIFLACQLSSHNTSDCSTHRGLPTSKYAIFVIMKGCT